MLYFPRINIKYHILSSQLVNFSLLVTCPGGWVCRCTSSPCWDCPCSRPPRPWRIGPRWQPAQWGKVKIKHILAFCFCHLLFKMSMRLLLKIGPLKVLSRVENFLCMIVDACTRNMILGIHYLLLKALLSMSMYYSTSNITASYLHSVIPSTKFVNQSEMIRCKMYICWTI